MAFFGQRVQASGSGGREVELIANCGRVGPVVLQQCGALVDPAPLGMASWGTGATVVPGAAAMQSLSFPTNPPATATVSCSGGSGVNCNGLSLGWSFTYQAAAGPPVPPAIIAHPGNWTIPLHCAGLTGGFNWTDTWIVVVTAGGGTTVVGHGGGGGALSPSGVVSITFAAGTVTLAPGDSLVIMLTLGSTTFGSASSFTFTSDQTIMSPLQWASENYVMGFELHPGSGSGSGATRPVVLAPIGCEYRLGREIGRSVVAASGSGSGGSGSGTNRPLVEVQDCCPHPSGSGSGEIIHTLCPGCPELLAVQFSFTISGVSAGVCNCASINGAFVVKYNPVAPFVAENIGCEWDGDVFPLSGTQPLLCGSTSFQWILQAAAGTTTLFIKDQTGAIFATYFKTAPPIWDCVSPITLFLGSPTSSCSTWPASVTIIPV